MNLIKITILFFLFLNSAISQSDNEPSTCPNSRDFGDTEICLPVIEGMKECYENSAVKLRADKTENEGNSILGFYITNDLYGQIDNFDQLNLDEYLKFYVVNNQKNKNAGMAELEEIAGIMGNNFMEENWDNLKSELDKKNSEISIGKPVLIESYSPDEFTKTYLFFTKLIRDEEDFVILMTMNVILVKDRIIWMAYYTRYNGDESVDHIKSGNDNAVKLFTEAN